LDRSRSAASSLSFLADRCRTKISSRLAECPVLARLRRRRHSRGTEAIRGKAAVRGAAHAVQNDRCRR
jgi:hypothetical protein